MNVRRTNAALTGLALFAVLLTTRAVAADIPEPLATHWAGFGPRAEVNGTSTRATVTLVTLGLILLSGFLGHATQQLWVGVLGIAIGISSAAAIYFTNRGLTSAADALPPNLGGGRDLALTLFFALLSVGAAATVDVRNRRRAGAL